MPALAYAPAEIVYFKEMPTRNHVRFSLLGSLLLFLFCVQLQAQPTAVPLRRMTGYNLSPRVEVQKGLNFWVLTSQKKFDKLFGIDKGTPPLPDAPDFSKEIVVVMAAPPTKKQMTIQFTGAMRAGSFIEVYCSSETDRPLTYTMYPIIVAAIPRIADVNTINYYEDQKLAGTAKVQY